MRTLVVGLGRAGAGLHVPVLRRARSRPDATSLFTEGPIVLCDPAVAPPSGDDLAVVDSVRAAARLLDPDRTVVHVCTPPTVRAALLTELARHGFRRVLVEKPLAADAAELDAILELGLRLSVVAPWLHSTLTDRLVRIVHRGEFGPLRTILVEQNKPRISRSLAGHGHPTAFDVELPHAVGVALRIAGTATLSTADSTDLVLGEEHRPGMGGASLRLHHANGVVSRLASDLMSPVRERRITLGFPHGDVVGHYAVSEDDDHAQLAVPGEETAVFRDDSLTECVVAAYRQPHGPDDRLRLAIETVRLLTDAKTQAAAGDATRVA